MYFFETEKHISQGFVAMHSCIEQGQNRVEVMVCGTTFQCSFVTFAAI